MKTTVSFLRTTKIQGQFWCFEDFKDFSSTRKSLSRASEKLVCDGIETEISRVPGDSHSVFYFYFGPGRALNGIQISGIGETPQRRTGFSCGDDEAHLQLDIVVHMYMYA